MDLKKTLPRCHDRRNRLWVLLAGMILLGGCGRATAGRTVTPAPIPTTPASATTALPPETMPLSGSPPTVVANPGPGFPGPTSPSSPPVTTRPVPAGASTTTTLATGGHTITVRDADSGRTFVVHRGDQLIVQLSGPSLYTWDEPVSSDDPVLHRTTGSSGASATATFVAAAPGHARVAATDNPNCYPRCLPPTRLFQIDVSVV